MKKEKFEQLDYYLKNYIVYPEEGKIISKKTNKEIFSTTNKKNGIIKLFNKRPSTYTVASVIAYKGGLMTKDNYHMKIFLKDGDKSNCKLSNLEMISLSEQNKRYKTGKILTDYWDKTGYKNRDQTHDLKYGFELRQKIISSSKKLSAKELSEKFKIPMVTIYRILKEKKSIETEDAKAKYIDETLTEKDKETIVSLYNAKINIKDIACFYRIPKKIIKQICLGELW